jgi:hypothetical protein
MRFYDTNQWKKLRAAILRDEPLCVRCSNMGVVRMAKVVDHCIPARDYHDFFDTDNLYPVCTQCHSDVTKHFDNKNAHKLFTNYAKVKYSGREFRRDEWGFPLDEDLDEKLRGLIDYDYSPPASEYLGEDSYTDRPHNKNRQQSFKEKKCAS